MREADWEREAARADVIHHCGAEVNFLYPYEKLRAANVFGTQEVLRLAARRAIPVHHVSTMSVVYGTRCGGHPAGHRGHRQRDHQERHYRWPRWRSVETRTGGTCRAGSRNRWTRRWKKSCATPQ